MTKQWLGSTSEIKSLAPTQELARPHKQRVELAFNGKAAIQVYDGTHGWNLRPFLNRREVEPLTPEEMKIASGQAELDGWLLDYTAKSAKIELVGMDKVDDGGIGLGRSACRRWCPPYQNVHQLRQTSTPKPACSTGWPSRTAATE